MTNQEKRIPNQPEEAQVRGAAERLVREGRSLDDVSLRETDTPEFIEKVRQHGQSVFGVAEVATVQVAETASATETDENKRELTPEQVDKLLGTLKTRFKAPENKKLRKAIDFSDVEKSLRAAPENLYTLHKLDETGGEPQVIELDGDEFVFEDRSKESPSGRRDLDADQAAAQAGEFGSDMQSPDAYKTMQKTGKYDLKSGSWLKTDPGERKRTGYALGGYRYEGGVYVDGYDAGYHYPAYGWRASLRVKKV